MTREEVVHYVRAAKPGTLLTVQLFGRSMWPLLRSGATARVVRCGEADVRPGDLVLLESSGGDLVAHLLVGVDPVRTRSFLGRDDAPAQVLGRVVAVGVAGRQVSLEGGRRRVLLALHRAASLAYRSEGARRIARLPREVLRLGATLPLRRRLAGRIDVRLLGPHDAAEVYRFVGHELPAVRPELLDRGLRIRWQRVGAAAGAFTARGRMVGFCWLDEYLEEGIPLDGFWIRNLVVAGWARGLGVAQALIGAVCEGAAQRGIDVVYADIRAENAASLRAFQHAGFEPAPKELARTLNALFHQRGRPGDFEVVQKVIAPGQPVRLHP